MTKDTNRKRAAFLLTALVTLITMISPVSANSAEITIPKQMPDTISPEFAQKYTYTEDGEYSRALDVPTYEWMPSEGEPKALVVGIHGLTLHGRRFRTFARTFAVNGIGFVSLDMRGFGRCRFDDEQKFSTKEDDKTKINHEKSYKDIVKLSRMVRQRYPDKPLIVLGESLGCTFCVRLAAENNDLVDGMILSAPAVKVNPHMYLAPSEVAQGVKAILTPHHKVGLRTFITKLVSERQDVINEMLDDPLILKEVSLFDLLRTDEFVEKTAQFGKSVSPKCAVLILQGGGDGCVASKSVTDLMMNIPSTNQTLRWLGHFGHLQLETSFVRAAVIDALGDWLEDQAPHSKIQLQALEQTIKNTGGTLVE